MSAPLAGIRIADLTHYYAGPYCTRLLSDMGAEVIKVESLIHYDPSRGPITRQFGRAYPRPRPDGELINQAGNTNKNNRNKLGITLDLTRPEARLAFRRLISVSDIVIESFSAGVLARFGYDFAELRKIQPDIIYAALPAMGSTGPEKHYRGFGTTIDMLSGIASLRGYLDGPPHLADINYGDPIAGVTAAGAVLLALHHRFATGEGQFIDLSQLQALVMLTGEHLLDAQMNDRDSDRIGNRHPSMAPHGVFPCHDEDYWVAIACRNDLDWERLCAVIGRPELGSDPRYCSLAARKANEEQLELLLAEWTGQRTRGEIAAALQAAGVPAGPVNRTSDLAIDPQLAFRGFFETITHPQAGTHAYPGIVWPLSETPGKVARPAPMLGQHNQSVLGDLLGLDHQQIADLEEAGVIGTHPTVDLWD